MRFHLLGLPHTVSSKEFNACAYTQKVVKFGKMMKARGHEIIHYGHEDSDLVCDEHVTVLTNDDFKKSYGSHDWKKTFFKFNTQDHAYQTFYKNAIGEIWKRKQKNDFLLPFWGSGVRPICDAHSDMIVVEPGIGYAGGHWARWKIFESYAIYHAYCGLRNVGECRQDWYEVVIPNYFDLEDFEYSDKKEDYFLYMGRVYDGKGVNVAIQATERAGVRLVIAGQKEEGYNLPKHVEYVGYADIGTRKQLMSKAKASFLPSMYVEPFGGVQIENLLSGTPTITTDWGSFAENNLHGITGYRCRTMGDFEQAIHNIEKINSVDCRVFGENFSLDKVSKMYEKYFQDVLNVYTSKGWYESSNIFLLNCYSKNVNFSPKIPRILHMIWVGEEKQPSYFTENYLKWKKLMPHWKFMIWDNSKLNEDYIDPFYLQMIKKSKIGAQKADLLRYYIVNKFGGYYVDSDIKPNKSLESINTTNADFIFCHDLPIEWEYIINAFFASVKDSPILNHIIGKMYGVDLERKDIQLTTGPAALGEAVFLKRGECSVLELPAHSFYRNKKNDQQFDGLILEEDIVDVYGYHMYTATWIK